MQYRPVCDLRCSVYRPKKLCQFIGFILLPFVMIAAQNKQSRCQVVNSKHRRVTPQKTEIHWINISETQRVLFEHTIHRINALVSPLKAIAKLTIVGGDRDGSVARETESGATIRIAHPKLLFKESLSEYEINRLTAYIVAHEYGHLILNKNLIKSEKLAKYIHLYLHQLALKDTAFELSRQISLETHAEKKQALTTTLGRTLQSMSQAEMHFIQEKMKLGLDLEAFQAMGELFADLIAVSSFDHLSAMREIIAKAPKKHHAETAVYRDFNHTFTVDGWHEWEPHIALAPTRTRLGKLISRSSPPSYEVIKTLFDVIQEHSESPDPKGWHPEKLNKGLIKSIQNNMKGA